jgi:hypothetical protein
MRAVTATFCLLLWANFAWSATKIDPLMSYAVDVGGSAIYLGRGFLITAAHVGGHIGEMRVARLGGQSISGKWIKAGSFDETDVSIMELDDVLLPNGIRTLRPIHLCTKPAVVDESVLVVAPGNVTETRVISPEGFFAKDDPRYKKFFTLIGDPETTGNSGSGVFDAAKRCLLGIVSRYMTLNYTEVENGQQVQKTKHIAKYFVPASEIRAFSISIPLLNQFFAK